MPSVLAFDSISFARGERMILSDLSWSVDQHQVAAVLGPNGSGKSTLLRLAAGYLWPQSGSIRLLDHTLGEFPLATLRARTGIVEATAVYPFDDGMTAIDVVCSGYFSALTIGYIEPTAEQWEHSNHMLEQVALAGRKGQLYATLSTGERMRCLIARALVRKPELLLLDEPTAGLDLPAREAVLATLRALTATANPPAVIIVTHHLEELLPDTANALVLDGHGRMVAAGHPDGVFTDATLSAAYGVSVHVTKRHGRYSAHVNPDAWRDLLA